MKDEPAFPKIERFSNVQGPGRFMHFAYSGGLTKRELFAAMAMQGLAADPTLVVDGSKLAPLAVDYADALIAELEKK